MQRVIHRVKVASCYFPPDCKLQGVNLCLVETFTTTEQNFVLYLIQLKMQLSNISLFTVKLFLIILRPLSGNNFACYY